MNIFISILYCIFLDTYCYDKQIIIIKHYKIELSYKKYDDYNIGEYYVITIIKNERQYTHIEDCRCTI